MPSSVSPEVQRHREANRRYRERWPEKFRAKWQREKAAMTEERREHRRALDRARYAKKREQVLAKKAFAVLTEERKQVLRDRRRAYYKANRKAQLASAKKYRDRTVERRAAYSRDHAKRFPEIWRARANRRRAVLAGCAGDFTIQQWSLLKGWYGNKCAKCRQEKKLHADHVTPITKGGSNMIENIQPLCKSCNSSKGTRIVRYPTPAAPFPCHP